MEGVIDWVLGLYFIFTIIVIFSSNLSFQVAIYYFY